MIDNLNLQLIGAFFIGIVSGFIGAISGGGGLISVPFLIFLGIHPQITLATSKFGGIGMCTGGLIKYIKENKIEWKLVPVLATLGILASFIGAKIMISSSPSSLYKIIGILLIALVPTLFLKNNFGIIEKKISNKQRILGFLGYFTLSILASFFGGMGPLLITNLIFFFGLSMIKANATDLVAYVFTSISAVIIFMYYGLVNYQIGILLFSGMFAGGYLGAHTALKKGDKWVKVFFSAIIIISAIKILLK